MHFRIALIPVLMVLAAILGAGCTGTSPGPAPTPTPEVTTSPVSTTQPTSTTTLRSLEPGPTVTLPPRSEVRIDVNRDPVTLNKEITAIFQGGSGAGATVRVDILVTHEDGTTETKSITRPESGSIKQGSSVTFNGSDRDRVEVTVWMNTGIPYKIIDQVYAQQTRP